jgi:predicted dehydrogenase
VTHHPFPGEIDDLVDAILGDRQALVNMEEGVRTHELMFAAEQSVREGQPVKLPLPG